MIVNSAKILKIPVLFIPEGMVMLKRRESFISDHFNINFI